MKLYDPSESGRNGARRSFDQTLAANPVAFGITERSSVCTGTGKSMQRPANFRQLLAETDGTPTENELSAFIARKKKLVYLKSLTIRLIGIGLFAGLAYFLFDEILKETQGSLWGALFFLAIFALLILGFAALTIGTLNHVDREELAKAEHALSALANANDRIHQIVHSGEEFILCLRGFERERIGGSEQSRPRTSSEITQLASTMDYTYQMTTGITPASLERSNEIRAQEYDWAWFRQLQLFRAVRELRPVVILDNFDIEPVKRDELQASNVQTLPTTSATWWGVFLQLVERARLVVVLLEQRSASVVRELDYLSSSNKAYVIVTTPGMVDALRRLAPSYVEKAAAVVRIADVDSAISRIRQILTEASDPRSVGDEQQKPSQGASAREQLEQQATSLSRSAPDVDWSRREHVVFRLALNFQDVKQLDDWEEPVWIEQAFTTNIAGICVGLLFLLLGLITQGLHTILPDAIPDLSLFFLIGLWLMFGSTIGLAVSRYLRLRGNHKHSVITSSLKEALSGRNYRNLMSTLKISSEELQWVHNVLQTQNAPTRP